MKWIDEPIGENETITFYKSCEVDRSTKSHIKEPLIVSVGNYVLLEISKDVRAYALIVNLLEDGNAKDLYRKTDHYFRADVLYLYNSSMLDENILSQLRKIIRSRNFNHNELFIPCNNTELGLVPNSMGTIQLDKIIDIVDLKIVNPSRKFKRDSYDVIFSRFGFANETIMNCADAIHNSVNYIKILSGLRAQQKNNSERIEVHVGTRKSDKSTNGTFYNIASVCKKEHTVMPNFYVDIEYEKTIKNQQESGGGKKKRGRPAGTKNKEKIPKDTPDYGKQLPEDCAVLLEDVIPLEVKNEIHKTKFDKVSCRDKEYRFIRNFLSNHLSNATSGCMYVSGVPGSGKTHTTLKVVENLMTKYKFKFIHINGMKILTPNQIYTILCKNILGEKQSISKSLISLCNHFDYSSKQNKKGKSSKNTTTILLVDELDCICNKNQSVLYHLFEWTSYNSSKLITITIANTMDLPERYFSNKVASRLGLVRLTFQPYSYDQLANIIQDIYVDSKFFEKDALQLISRKVAAVSGDVRRCLDVCQKAIEIAKSTMGSKQSDSEKANSMNTRFSASLHVSMKDVMSAINAMFSSNKTNTLELLSEYEKLFLKCLFNWTKPSNVALVHHGVSASKSITLSKLKLHINSLIHAENLTYLTINSQQIVDIAFRLINSRILKMESARNYSIHTEISLDVPLESIGLVLENV